MRKNVIFITYMKQSAQVKNALLPGKFVSSYRCDSMPKGKSCKEGRGALDSRFCKFLYMV